MRDTIDTYLHLMSFIELDAFPSTKDKPRQLLDLLICGEPVTVETIYRVLGHNARSALQALEGDRFKNWNILTIKDSKTGNIVARRLDPRHFQGRRQDALARAERRKELKERSFKQAKDELLRVPEALMELEAANDALCELQSQEKQENEQHKK